ncbi:MAG TPA: SusC/RagA family TonB-linked outer membrane protein, partial [Prolixibacteraceae bacterium]|nr:SusC/RagA family TonB-linked outer membrane protein [Prolixibacteraceae bacterium]
MKKIALFLSILLFMGNLVTNAQTKMITGTVTSAEDNEPIPGVSVSVEGTTLGTITNLDGQFEFSVPSDAQTLVFSFVGMKNQEIAIGSETTFNVEMEADVLGIDEVVVTALGVTRRNAREVVYATQTVNSEDLLSTPTKNALEGLRGKTAGVKLSTGSGSVGASTRIVLRGESSLTGNNNALIVVDGIAIDNSTTSGGAEASTTGYSDFGNRFNDLNPNDIESVTVLKGPSATSLYGSRGSAGVVLITTKKGSKGTKMRINYSGAYSRESAIVLLQRQNKFGQGYDNTHFDSGENWSWGPELDGVVRPWTSPIDSDGDGSLEALIRPYSAVENQLKDFFNTGLTQNHNFNISGAKDGFTYFASYGNTNQDGILDNTYYNRNNISFNASAQLSEKLRSDFKVSYANIRQNTVQEGSRAFEGNNAYAMAIQSPINIPFTELKDYNSPYHDIDGYWGSYSSVNPYYILNEYGNEANIDNFLGNASLTYEILDGLSITGRVGSNIVNTNTNVWTPPFSPSEQLVWTDGLQVATRNTKHESLGDYTRYTRRTENIDALAMVNYSETFGEDFTLEASSGYSFFQRKVESLTGSTVGGLTVPGVYILANSVENPSSDQNKSKYMLYGALANATFGYKNAAFLELSIRNDWSSTLPAGNNSFLYGAVGTSLIFTDLFNIESDVLNMGKLRASWGTTGKDAGLYLLDSYFIGNPLIVGLGDYELFFPKDGIPGFTLGNRIGNPSLKPELTATYEVGTDLGLFKDIVNLSYTYYKSVHADQIVVISLPRSTGYTQTAANIGEMVNKGHELTLSLKPLNRVVNGLDFEMFASYSKNDNEVIKITDDLDELTIGSFGFAAGTTVDLVAKEGLPFGTFK